MGKDKKPIEKLAVFDERDLRNCGLVGEPDAIQVLRGIKASFYNWFIFKLF